MNNCRKVTSSLTQTTLYTVLWETWCPYCTKITNSALNRWLILLRNTCMVAIPSSLTNIKWKVPQSKDIVQPTTYAQGAVSNWCDTYFILEHDNKELTNYIPLSQRPFA